MEFTNAIKVLESGIEFRNKITNDSPAALKMKEQLQNALQLLQAAEYVITEMQPKPGWNIPYTECTKSVAVFTLRDGHRVCLQVTLTDDYEPE